MSQVPFERAVATSRLAIQFSDAAMQYRPEDGQISLVSYFLVGHALELSFKAVLIVHGVTEKKLRDLGHDLQRCHVAARVHLPDGLLDAGTVGQVVNMISPFYCGKAFEYVFVGFARLPEPRSIMEAVRSLVEVVGAWVERTVHERLSEP